MTFIVPTGGACVSLDPGWGSDDDPMWIMKRSTHIQGVTNIVNAVMEKLLTVRYTMAVTTQ